MDIETREIERFKEIDLYKKSYKQLLGFVNLNTNEEILINLRLFPFGNIFINNVRERYAKYLILTTDRIIFVVNRGYLSKKFFSYNKITDIVTTRKWYISGNQPVIIIKTENNTYEIMFTTLFYRKQVEGIVNCIKK